jgi:hypothetical protein
MPTPCFYTGEGTAKAQRASPRRLKAVRKKGVADQFKA